MNVVACACPRQVCSPGSPCRRSEWSCWCGAHLVCWAMLQGEGQRLLWGSALLRCPGCGDCAGGLFAVCHCPDACSALSCTCWFDGIGEHNSSQVLSAQPEEVWLSPYTSHFYLVRGALSPLGEGGSHGLCGGGLDSEDSREQCRHQCTV